MRTTALVKRWSAIAQYVVAALMVTLATAATVAVRPWMGASVSVLFFPAIVLIAIYGGYGPALVATILSTVSMAYFLVPPLNSFDIGPDDAIRLAVFAVVAIATASVSAARKRAEDAQRKAFGELHVALSTLRKVSDWPVFVDSSVASGARKLLDHASSVVGASCSAAVWEVDEEPWVHVAVASPSHHDVSKRVSTELAPIVPEQLDGSSFCSREALAAAMVLTVSRRGVLSEWRGPAAHPALMAQMTGTGFASAPFQVEHLRGRAFFSGLSSAGADLIPLVEVVAREIGNSIDQFYLHDRLQQLAIREDRIRVARDLHDGVLQSLTGIRYQLQAMANDPAAAASVSDRLLAAERAIAIEQRELRLFIEDLKPAGRQVGFDAPLAQGLEELRRRLGAEWNTPIAVRVMPADLALPPTIEHAIRLMIHEAAINALKHAHPSRVSVDVQAHTDRVQVLVTDDGRGFGFRGRLDHGALAASNAGPVSLRERIESVGGLLAIESVATGSRVEITIPLAAEGA